jgi:hypothetical protein
MSGEKKYYLANLPVKTSFIALAATIKARWVCEQACQLKEELGLDHFEGRSGKAFTVMRWWRWSLTPFSSIAGLAAARREKKNQRASASANFTRPAPRHPRTHRLTDTAISTLQKVDQQQAAAWINLPK